MIPDSGLLFWATLYVDHVFFCILVRLVISLLCAYVSLCVNCDNLANKGHNNLALAASTLALRDTTTHVGLVCKSVVKFHDTSLFA